MDTDPAMLSVIYEPPEPSLRNGDVTGYVIRYTRVGSGVLQMITVNGGRGFHYISSGLVAFTNYSVDVAAINVNGTGPFSNAVYGASGQDSKQSIMYYELFTILTIEPSAPRSLSKDALNSTSVTLSWLPPENPNGVILHYEVVQHNGNISSSLVNFNNTLMGTVEGLSRGTNYTLKIRAYTKVGPGPFSNNITAYLSRRKLQ